ncbi:MAG: cytochrome P450 [Gemmatimonadetes bacterium]|nr:cytochrome P450 [Gemmatimonadota bacterium]
MTERAPVIQVPEGGFVKDAVRDWPRLPELYHRHGPVFKVVDAGVPYVFAFSPDATRQVVTRPDLLHTTLEETVSRRAPEDSALRRLGSGIHWVNGARHREQRQLFVPGYHRRQVAAYADIVVRQTERMLARWRVGDERNLYMEMSRLALAFDVEITFGVDSPDDPPPFVPLLLRYSQEIFDVPSDVEFGIRDVPPSLLELAEELEGAVLEHLARVRAGAAPGHGYSMLVQAADETGVMGDRELVGNALSLFLAGHDSVASALASALVLLALHPRVAADLADELHGVLGGAPPRVEELDRLPLLNGVVLETLRLFPPGPWAKRVAVAPAEVGPFAVAEGGLVIYSAYVTHRIPELYPEPQRFRPERWRGASPAPYAFIPFGAGQRQCIGHALALMELRLVLATVLQRHRLSLSPGTVINRGMAAGARRELTMRVYAQDRRFAADPVEGNIRQMVDLD